MTEVADGPGGWTSASRAALLLAVDPGLGGAVVRAGPGPVRDAWQHMLRSLLPETTPWRRLPARLEDDRLLGGLDLAAALDGRRRVQPGLLVEADGGVVIAPMAERMTASVAARLTAALDRGEIDLARDGLNETHSARFLLVALDESSPDDSPCPEAVADRLAFRLDLTRIGAREAQPISAGWSDIVEARAGLAAVETPDAAVQALCGAAEALGVWSLRGPMLALRAARANAALEGRGIVEPEDLALAAELVLAPRATRRPAAPEASPDAEPPLSDTAGEGSGETDADARALDDMVVNAAAAALPPEIEALWAQAQRSRAAIQPRQAGGGARLASRLRGRRIGVRPGSPRAGVLDVVETLKAAAPWQKLRRGIAETERRLHIRRDDFRVRRFERRAESTVILVVDASGSAAMQRLAETKGAVELLLAEAYVRRTQVALIAFRGQAAEVLLPPTRSLTRARRRLTELAGGGATPLASGLETAGALALAEKAKGHTPLLVVMTDGRGNVALDGAAFRTRAQTDATAAAVRIGAAGVRAVLIDISARPRDDAPALAQAMGARFAVLPYVQAGAVRDLVRGLELAG